MKFSCISSICCKRIVKLFAWHTWRHVFCRKIQLLQKRVHAAWDYTHRCMCMQRAKGSLTHTRTSTHIHRHTHRQYTPLADPGFPVMGAQLYVLLMFRKKSSEIKRKLASSWPHALRLNKCCVWLSVQLYCDRHVPSQVLHTDSWGEGHAISAEAQITRYNTRRVLLMY